MGELTLGGHGGVLHARSWDRDDPLRIVMLVHGYGEHIGRYEHVAEALVARGYELVDTWENASDFRKQLPFTSATRIRWFGHYLRLRDAR